MNSKLKWGRSSVLLMIAAVLLLSVLYFSTQKPQQDAAADQVLMVGTNVWSGYEPLYLARSMGQYDPATIQLVEHSSTSQVIRAFRNGLLQAAAVTLDEFLLLRESQLDVSIILVTDISKGADAIISKPEFNHLKDLKGKRIGVEDTALGAYFLSRALDIQGLSPSDFTIVSLSADQMEKAYDDGSVEAVVTFDPVRTKLLSKGGRQIFDSTSTPGEIVDVLVVHNGYAEQHPDNIDQLLRGWFAALANMEIDPDGSAEVFSKRLELPVDQVWGSFDGLLIPGKQGNLKMIQGDIPVLLESLIKMQKVMIDKNLMTEPVDLSRSINPKPMLRSSK